MTGCKLVSCLLLQRGGDAGSGSNVCHQDGGGGVAVYLSWCSGSNSNHRTVLVMPHFQVFKLFYINIVE